MACQFFEMLERRWAAGARVCVGLDTEAGRIPSHLTNLAKVSRFNEDIVLETKEFALAYKPNIAFYSGGDGYLLEELRRTIEFIRGADPTIPIILDAKRADIGNTNAGYVAEAFDRFGADAVTVNPYFGMEAMRPFLEQKDKGVIVLCRTSNQGAREFQDLVVKVPEQDCERWGLGTEAYVPFYEYVARRVATHWNQNGNCSLVVGATYPEELVKVRALVGDDMWLLMPGFGKQGGDVGRAVRAGINSRGSGIISNSSSGIIFASDGHDFAKAARRETLKLAAEIERAIP